MRENANSILRIPFDTINVFTNTLPPNLLVAFCDCRSNVDVLGGGCRGGEKMPAKEGEVYTCEKCDNVVRVEEGGAGTLVCCGQPMDCQD